jgi:glycosyltransferase involved in cell wall biosynthesis
MKVLQIIPSISLVYGGPSQMIRGLSRALAAAGAEVTILTTNSNGDTGQPPLQVPLDRPVVQDGYQIRYFPCAPFRRYKFSWGLLAWLARHGRTYDIAHIHALFSPVSTAAATVARWQGLPYVLRPLGTLDPEDLRKKKRLKALYGRWLEAPNLAGAAAVHFTSTQEARVSHRFGATTQDVVIPLGVSLPQTLDRFVGADSRAQVRSQWGIPDDRPLVLFMSRVDPKKGLDLLLPSLMTLQKEGQRFHFVLAGANPQDPRYEAHIQDTLARSPLAPCTTIAGFLQGSQKWATLAAADVLVLPSYYENFGIAVAEALAVGVPVVVSEGVYIWEDIMEARAGWVVPCEVKGLTDTLRQVLLQGEERQRRGRNGQDLARRLYHWDAIAPRLMELYGQGCAGKVDTSHRL